MTNDHQSLSGSGSLSGTYKPARSITTGYALSTQVKRENLRVVSTTTTSGEISLRYTPRDAERGISKTSE